MVKILEEFDRRKLRRQTSDFWTNAATDLGRFSEKREREREREREEKEDQIARKGRKIAIAVFFQCFEAPEGQKVGSLKRWVWSHLASCASKKIHLAWRQACFSERFGK